MIYRVSPVVKYLCWVNFYWASSLASWPLLLIAFANLDYGMSKINSTKVLNQQSHLVFFMYFWDATYRVRSPNIHVNPSTQKMRT